MRRVPFEKLSVGPGGRGVYVDWAHDSIFIRRGCECFFLLSFFFPFLFFLRVP